MRELAQWVREEPFAAGSSWALRIAIGVVLPPPSRRQRWAMRGGPRHLAIYVCCAVVRGVAVRVALQWLVGAQRRVAAQQASLDRDPTPDELCDYFKAHPLTWRAVFAEDPSLRADSDGSARPTTPS